MTREDRDSNSSRHRRLDVTLRVMATNPIAPHLCPTFARCQKTQPLSGPGITYAGYDEEDRRAPGNQVP